MSTISFTKMTWNTLSIYTKDGDKKYLTKNEARKVLAEIRKLKTPYHAYGLILYFTGCRPGEPFHLKASHFDLDESLITIRTLKTANTFYRNLPVPPQIMRDLNLMLDIRGKQSSERGMKQYVFTFHRKTGAVQIKDAMTSVGIKGACLNPKALRHTAGRRFADEGIAPDVIMKLLGHSSLFSTQAYLDASGRELRAPIENVFREDV